LKSSRNSELFDRAAAALRVLGGAPATAWFVPGRLEVLGKHTDYAGGRTLVCALERGICAAAVPRHDSRVRIVDAATTSVASVELSPDGTAGGWANYPATVARRIAQNFSAARGADIAFISNLPPAAGMSSSSALMIAVFLLLADFNELQSADAYRRNIRTPEDLAGYLATVENGQTFGSLVGDPGVGTFGGSEDHTAILCCEADRLSQYRFAPVRHELSVTLPIEYVFVIASSGVAAEKTGGAREAYNRAAATAAETVRAWRRATGRVESTLGGIVESGVPADTIRDVIGHETTSFSPLELLDRFEQFFEESEEIVPAVTSALSSGNVDAIGALVDRSQGLAETLLGNQVPETIALARSARELGATAASAFGAGFGGSVWALVRHEQAEEFRRRWTETYARAFPNRAPHAEFFTTRPGPAALRLPTR
jgi:galactokinase